MSEPAVDDPVVDPEPVQEPTGEPESDPEPEDDPEPEEDPDDPQEPGDEQLRQQALAEQGLSEKELEKGFQRLEAEAQRHAKRIGEIMGEDATMLVACELCAPNLPGFRFPHIPPDDVVQRVRVAIGLADFTELAKAEHVRECDKCRGRGSVLSGSKVPGKETVQCPPCKGNGFLHIGGTPTPVAADVAPTNGDVVFTADLEPTSETDPWGRLPTDPLFGVMPNLVAQRQAVQ